MSRQVDERIVSMQFDNRNFERNVQTSMSTLDKLKAKLRFGDAGKSLDSLSSAAKKVNFNPLISGVQEVHARFSALEVMGVTALANITNSAVNAGKRMIEALTLDPVMTGFQEYETQINSVQTILSNTRSKGSTLDDVNAALDELNKYADMTIYNFTEMTKNIGTFTAAGVDLEKSVSSIKGIANLAAVSGSTSLQASTAMYQLSQALAAGRVSLMDWNSVVNAGMGGELFQTALIRTARVMGTGVDEAIEKYGTFRESLTKGQWLTADVLTETLSQLSGAYTEADLLAKGYTQEQAKEITALAKDAVDAATKVKTFTQLWDTMKEAAQSGWTQTWEIIIGDYEEAKELLTSVSDFFTGDNGIITKFSNARNNLLEGALNNNPFTKLAEKIDKVTGVTEEMTKATQKYGEVVDKVIRGDYGNGQSRWDKLTQEGYDWAYVQNLVNERLGDSTRHATNFKESQEGLQKTQATTIEQLIAMSDEQLRNLGFTQDEIDAFNELEKQSEATGIPIKSLLEDMSQLNGRTLLINSFKNAAQGLIKVFTSVGQAWREVFPPMQSEQLYNMIAALHKFSTNLIMSDENAEKLQRTFRGLFALIDIITTILGGGLKIALMGVSSVLKAFGLSALDVTANLGDLIYNFRNFLLENELVTKGFQAFGEGVAYIIKSIVRLVQAFAALPTVQKAIENFKNGLTGFKEIGQNIVDGLVEGIQNGTFNIVDSLIALGKKILDTIKDILGVQSPSWKAFEIAMDFVQGFVNGIKAGFAKVREAMSSLGSNISEAFKNSDWLNAIIEGVKNVGKVIADVLGNLDLGSIVVVSVIFGFLYMLNRVITAFEENIPKIFKPLEAFSNLMNSAAGAITNVGNAMASNLKAQAVKSLAMSLLMLVGAIVVMSQIKPEHLWSAIGALAALMLMMALFSAGIGKFGPQDTKAFVNFGIAVGAVSTSLLFMTFALSRLEKTDPDKFPMIIKGFATIVLSLLAVVGTYALLTKGGTAVTIERAGNLFLKLSASMLIMTEVVRRLGNLSEEEIAKGIVALTAFTGVFTILGLISRLAPGVSSLGSNLMKMSAAMLILILVIKLVGSLSAEEIVKGVVALGAFIVVFALLTLITRLGGTVSKGLGTTLIAMAGAMLLMALVVKLLGGMEASDILKGVAALGAFVVLIGFMTLITRLAKSDMPKLAAPLLAMAAAIGILALIAVLLGLVKIENLAKGITAVGLLSAFMALMLYTSRGVNEIKGNLIVMSVAIGVMALAAAALSAIPIERLAPATAALVSMMAAFALMAKMAGGMRSNIPQLIMVTLAIGIMAGIVALLAQLNTDIALENAAGLSLLLMSMSAALALASVAGSNALKAAGSMAIMAVVVAGLAYVFKLIQDMQIQANLQTVLGLSVMLIAMSASIAILSAVGQAASGAFIGIAALVVLITAIGALVAGIGALVTEFPQLQTFLETGIPILEKIGYALGSFFGNIIGGFSAGITSGLPEMGTNISTFITNMQPGLDVLKGVDSSALGGIGVIAGVLAAIGASSFIDTIFSILTLGGDTMDRFGENISKFADIMVTFSDSVSGKVDPAAIEATANAGAALAEMQVLQGVFGIIDSIFGTADLETFGEQIKAYGEAMVGFSKAVSAEGAINSEAIEAAKNAGLIMVELQEAVKPVGGVMQDLLGTSDLGVFGEQLVAYGDAIVKFSNKVSEEGAINTEAITAAQNAGLIMTELQKAVEPVGGVAQALAGTSDLGKFGEQLVAYGEAIVDFSDEVSGEETIDKKAIEAAQNAGLIMTELQKNIEPMGGVFDFFEGTTSMADFGEDIAAFGEALVGFSETVNEGGGIDQEAATAAYNAGLIMSDLQKALPTDKWGDGKMSLSTFGSHLSTFGQQIKNLSDKVTGIDSVAINQSYTAAMNGVALMKNIVDLDATGVDEFKKIKDIGSSLKNYGGSIEELDWVAITSSIISVNSLVSAIKGMVGLDASGVETFGSALKTLGETSLKSFIQPFIDSTSQVVNLGQNLIANLTEGVNNKQSAFKERAVTVVKNTLTAIGNKKNEFLTTAEQFMAQFIQGIGNKESETTNKFTTLLTTCDTLIRGYYGTFYNAGDYLVLGFAAGIDENTFKAEAKAAAMARAALEAAEEELDENSPSEESYRVGAFFGQGFVNAVGDYAGKAYVAGSSMADKARVGLGSAIRRMTDAISSDMDTTPTIRPVLDLSDIQAGSAAMNDLLSMGSSMNLLTNVGRIGYAMNRNRQFSQNSEVVSAIDKLRKDLGNVGGTTYQVNGITYDDGSNISDAVRSLVRAARIDRRV